MFCQPPFAQPYLTPKENEFDKDNLLHTHNKGG